MRLPLRLPARHPARTWLVAALIAGLCGALAMVLRVTPPAAGPLAQADQLFYDAFYRMRPVRDMRDESVVIVAIDDNSLDRADRELDVGWPWPRDLYGWVIKLADRCGAKAVAFDLLF